MNHSSDSSKRNKTGFLWYFIQNTFFLSGKWETGLSQLSRITFTLNLIDTAWSLYFWHKKLHTGILWERKKKSQLDAVRSAIIYVTLLIKRSLSTKRLFCCEMISRTFSRFSSNGLFKLSKLYFLYLRSGSHIAHLSYGSLNICTRILFNCSPLASCRTHGSIKVL